MKGITPVVATIMLLIIAVAIVGLAYGFITGFFSGVTRTAAIVSGVSSCSGGAASIVIRNAGTGTIVIASDVTFTRTGCTSGGALGLCPAGQPTFTGPTTIGPGASATLTDGTLCGAGNSCRYDVAIGGVVYPTRVDC